MFYSALKQSQHGMAKVKKTAKIRQHSTPFPTSNSFNQLSDPEGDVVRETYGDKPTFSKRKPPVHNESSGVNKTPDLHKPSRHTTSDRRRNLVDIRRLILRRNPT